ncbi:cell filamentation protein Fic, partial [Streptomyces chartreusis]
MTEALVDHYGRWVLGWRWARDEGDIGGGPIGSWCCPRDSITSPEETLARVMAALCEWRAWLEALAEHFDRFRLDDVPVEDRRGVWESAAVDLVTFVVDRTSSGDAWYE